MENSNIIKGTTTSGFAFEIDKTRIDDMEFIDTLAELKQGDYLAISRVADFLLGKEQKKALYEHIRKQHGTAKVSVFGDEITEILSYREETKN